MSLKTNAAGRNPAAYSGDAVRASVVAGHYSTVLVLVFLCDALRGLPC